ncbi:collagen alpha-1(XXIII) chain-like [Parus major]|uniref:collagen alpha-1(XXIII) chain-like n=1 Tax=Parus major TaxID=9157 RepID=UPI001444873D|nr:collagen alpha-1(XXIII) chain-like [Parus major]
MSAGSGSGAAGAAGTATSALCLLLSLTAVAVCLLLGAKTAELQGRLAALEERGAAGHGPLLDALQPRVEQLFREKLGEGLVKLRAAREAPSDCVCPPGSHLFGHRAQLGWFLEWDPRAFCGSEGPAAGRGGPAVSAGPRRDRDRQKKSKKDSSQII